MLKKSIRFFTTLTLIVLVLAGFLVYYIFFTTSGSGFLVRRVLGQYLKPEQLAVKNIDNNLATSLQLHDVEMRDLQGWPKGSAVWVQSLEVSFGSFSLAGVKGKINNGRIQLPDASPILFYGDFDSAALNINVYAKQISLSTLADFLTQPGFKTVSGIITDLDVLISGELSRPQFRGELKIEELTNRGFAITNCPVSFNLAVANSADVQLFGTVELAQANLSGPKTARIIVGESRLTFSGNPLDPALELNGNSIVERVKMHLTLRGTAVKPDLRLSSEPPFSEQKLLLMLTTGKSWSSLETSFSQGQLSPDVAKDFLDYFVFAGSKDNLAGQLGIDAVSLKYDDQIKGFSLKKAISDKLEATYDLQQAQQKNNQNSSTQKIGGIYKITDSVSLGVEKEVTQPDLKQRVPAQINDKVTVEYKQQF